MTDPKAGPPQGDAHRFPVTVDIPVPQDGFGAKLDEMLDWCRDQFGEDQWTQHSATVAWPPSAPGVDVARFCFATEEQGDQFERRWCR